MVLTLYQDLLSQPVRAISIFLKQNQIKFEEKNISLVKGEQRAADYLKEVPSGQVPAIKDDGFILTESVAILQYLCTKPNVKINWLPTDAKARARVQQYMSWQHTCTRKHGSAYFIAKFLNPMLSKTKPDAAKVAEAAKDLNKTLDYIENNFLASTKYLAGDQISIADLLGICEIMQPVAVGFDVEKGRPKLTAWMARVKQYLGSTFDDAHRPLLELTAKAI